MSCIDFFKAMRMVFDPEEIFKVMCDLCRAYPALGIHKMTAAKKNIWTYRLQGEKRERKLNGMLISDPLTVLDLNALPEANPLLMAETSMPGTNNNSGVPPGKIF